MSGFDQSVAVDVRCDGAAVLGVLEESNVRRTLRIVRALALIV